MIIRVENIRRTNGSLVLTIRVKDDPLRNIPLDFSFDLAQLQSQTAQQRRGTVIAAVRALLMPPPPPAVGIAVGDEYDLGT